MSILSYFEPAENDSLYGEALHSTSPVIQYSYTVLQELRYALRGS